MRMIIAKLSRPKRIEVHMPFIPHTDADLLEMLQTLNVSSIDTLFDEIPDSLPRVKLDAIPPALSEMALKRLMQKRSALDGEGHMSCFIGAGAYEHHIPAAVWEL